MSEPGSLAGDDLTLRSTLATGCRILAMEGHGDLVWGHMSVRQPGTPSSVKRAFAALSLPKYWFSASFSGVILLGSVSA